MSAFLLLFIGVIIAVVLALLECFYFKYFRKIFGKCETWMCCNLLSIDLANSIQKPDNTNKFEEQIQNPTSSATNSESFLFLRNKTEKWISVQDHESSINNWIQLDFIQYDSIGFNCTIVVP